MLRLLSGLALISLLGCDSLSEKCVQFSSTTPLPPNSALWVVGTLVADGGPSMGIGETNPSLDAGLPIGLGESCSTGPDLGRIHAVAWIDPGATQAGDGGCAVIESPSCAPRPGELSSTADFTLNSGDHVTVPLEFH